MRSMLTGLVVAATTVFVPILAWADNQGIANQIATKLRESGKLSQYRIAVKFEDGTASLIGCVRDREQMRAALKMALKSPEVKRVVNGLTIASPEAARPTAEQKATPKLLVIGQPQTTAKLQLGKSSGKSPSTSTKVPPSAKPKQGSSPMEALPRIPIQKRDALVAAAAPFAVPVAAMQQFQRVPQGTPYPTQVAYMQGMGAMGPGRVPGRPIPMYTAAAGGGVTPAQYDQPRMPNHAWPSYSAYPNYAALTYPKQYSPTAWPFIGPFYPYPQVPLGWRKVTLEWDDGWWMLDFKDSSRGCRH